MIINKDEFLRAPKMHRKKLREDIFIYPADSIYSLGCDATNQKLVKQVRELKKNSVQPFSIIPPSKEWITKNCIVSKSQRPYLEHLDKENPKLQGKSITLLLELRQDSDLAANVVQGNNTVSIKIFDHWFMKEVKMLGIPIIYASANPAGGDLMTNLSNVNNKIKKSVSLIIYEGEKTGNPSMVVNP